jgi:hypothetical protein
LKEEKPFQLLLEALSITSHNSMRIFSFVLLLLFDFLFAEDVTLQIDQNALQSPGYSEIVTNNPKIYFV